MSFCILEDEIPRNGGRWPEYAATMLLCFDGWESGVAVGQLWTFYFKEPRPFLGLDSLLFKMEAVMDEAGQPTSWCRLRRLPEGGKRRRREPPAPIPAPIRAEPYHPFGALDGKRGTLCTAALRVYARQNASIQGEIRFSGGPAEPVYFRSALELLHLLHERLEQATAKEVMEP